MERVVQPEARFEVPLANARLKGRIDLVLQAEGGGPNKVELVDFKTSSNRPPDRIHQNQLRLYAAAAEQLGYQPAGLYIHDLDADLPATEDPRIPVANDDREREAFRDELESWVEGIRGSDFEPTEDKRICRTCDFRRFCRYAPTEARTA